MHSLLGRDPIKVDVDGSYLTGKTVLVTGAGGSIGSEIARQVCRHNPAKLLLLGHGESTLAATYAGTKGDREIVLADIRDRERLAEVFELHHPDVVFHAAALKHVPLLELAPDEAVKTNVCGTANVLAAAADTGVKVLVNISTDKACNPIGVLGLTKRLGERMTAWYGSPERGWMSVRFGNVLGSRGSVLITFASQIAAGGPITVTHPDMDRYLMTIPEAASLVLQAGAVGKPGECLVLDMGEPVRITELAQRMAVLATGTELPIVYTGLRPGERLHEELLGPDEVPSTPHHPLIRHVDVPPLSPAEALAAFKEGVR